MKRIALAAGAVVATLTATAFAQGYYTRPHDYDPYWNSRSADGEECWNPRARHYEGVRPGEVQNDLDFSRCRSKGARYYGEQRYYPQRPLERDSWRGFSHECWNPRDERWEVLRPGEIQDSLDRNRCRPYREP